MYVEGIGDVSFQKRRGTKSLKLHIRGDSVKVTMPYFYPYSKAKQYLLSKQDWVKRHLKTSDLLTHGTFIGKKHKIIIEEGANDRVYVKNDVIRLTQTGQYPVESAIIQSKLKKGSERALLHESKQLLLPRLQDIATENGLEYKSAKAKKLKSRWGSCDSNNNISLNIYLLQLPWHLIDYVIVHELAHTLQKNHSSKFWDEVGLIIPNHKQLRKEIKEYDTNVVVA